MTGADEPSGMLADLECVKNGRIAFAIEVKDRQITISQLRAKLRTIREKQVSEIFFVATQGTVPSEYDDIESLIEHGSQVVTMFTLLTWKGSAGRRWLSSVNMAGEIF